MNRLATPDPRPKRRRALHRVSRRLPHLMLAGCCALTVAGLSGCVITDNANQLDDLAESSVQDALSSAGSAFESAGNDIGNAFSDAQGDVADAGNSVANAFSDAGNTLTSLSDIPSLLAGIFSDSALANKADAVEVSDAQTGAALAQYSGNELTDMLGGLDYNSWRLVSSVPDDAEPEYRLRITQWETLKAGQSEEDRKRVEAATITTYRGVNVVEITLAGVDLTVHLELPEADIAAFRNLAA